MTAKQVFKNTAIELSKVNAPALKLYEFNYYFNKAISHYINQVYNVFDVNQQSTDDLRVLQDSVYMTPTKIKKANQALVSNNTNATSQLSTRYSQLQSVYGAAYECYLPMDYLHLLNCICTFEVISPYDCYDAGTFVQKAATRLTSDSWALIMDDIYNRPSPERPYFQIYNQNRNISNGLPTNPITEGGNDTNGVYGVETYDSETLAEGETKGSNFKRTFTFKNGHKESLVEKTAAQRLGNPSNVRLEIRYGKDDSLFKLREVQVDYIKVPQFIRLTQEQIDLTQDTSQILEWPDYIVQEITNILVTLLMERLNNPRLTTNFQINQTIPRAGQSTQQSATTQTQ